MRSFERLTTPAKTFLISFVCCLVMSYWSRFPSELWKFPVIIALIGFGLLRLFRATEKRIFKALYIPWLIFGSGFILRAHGRMYPLQQKWIMGAHFVAILICASSFLALLSSREVYVAD